ncbi:MAG: hypothetical protein ABL308_06235 [Oceanicaulis sp.]
MSKTLSLAVESDIAERARPVAEALGVSVDALAGELLAAVAASPENPGLAEERLCTIVARFERATSRHRPMRADIYKGYRCP